MLRCTRDGIRINTFMLDANSYLTAFVERLTEINRGRAFFTTPEDLGDYVLVDFIEHKKRRQAPRRAAPAEPPPGDHLLPGVIANPPLRGCDVIWDNHIAVITSCPHVAPRITQRTIQLGTTGRGSSRM